MTSYCSINRKSIYNWTIISKIILLARAYTWKFCMKTIIIGPTTPKTRTSLQHCYNNVYKTSSQGNLTKISDAAGQVVLHEYVLALQVTMCNTGLAYNSIYM